MKVKFKIFPEWFHRQQISKKLGDVATPFELEKLYFLLKPKAQIKKPIAFFYFR